MGGETESENKDRTNKRSTVVKIFVSPSWQLLATEIVPFNDNVPSHQSSILNGQKRQIFPPEDVHQRVLDAYLSPRLGSQSTTRNLRVFPHIHNRGREEKRGRGRGIVKLTPPNTYEIADRSRGGRDPSAILIPVWKHVARGLSRTDRGRVASQTHNTATGAKFWGLRATTRHRRANRGYCYLVLAR
ncbi:hypothetical protein KQX54_016503 [Cotesia glomerata]|uniref:Uncharacterized protein n=1 Tax=Cotesia glomerata TaxID=32391 RepID=A0AAV7HUR7_COTGL|nr:hypothetical protein KQX54_016503 [Cotesia glomerata]